MTSWFLVNCSAFLHSQQPDHFRTPLSVCVRSDSMSTLFIRNITQANCFSGLLNTQLRVGGWNLKDPVHVYYSFSIVAADGTCKTCPGFHQLTHQVAKPQDFFHESSPDIVVLITLFCISSDTYPCRAQSITPVKRRTNVSSAWMTLRAEIQHDRGAATETKGARALRRLPPPCCYFWARSDPDRSAACARARPQQWGGYPVHTYNDSPKTPLRSPASQRPV